MGRKHSRRRNYLDAEKSPIDKFTQDMQMTIYAASHSTS